MKTAKEKQILKIIRYTPPIFIIIVSIFITYFLYSDYKQTFLAEKNRIETEYISRNKHIIKEEVERIHHYITHLQEKTEKELKQTLKNRVYEAHTIATNIYNTYKDTKTKEEIIELIKLSLGSIRFHDNRGYYFMDDIKGTKILYPINKNLEGKVLIDLEDKNGYKLIQTIVDTIKDKSERFDEYYWEKPTQKGKTFKKISFYKYFEPYDLSIGTGEYIDDFEKNIQKKVLDYTNLIRYGENGYIFIIDYDTIYLSHIRPNYIGKSAVANNDTVAIRKVIYDLIDISKKGSGYYSYIQNKKPDTQEATNKVSFVKGLNNWGWMIGTGFYEDDLLIQIENRKKVLDDKFGSYVQNIFIVSIILTITLLMISIYVAKLLENKFTEYKKDLNKQQNILFQQSKMAAMGEMIGNIAHQWRQPLSTITTAASGMKIQKEFNTLDDDIFFKSVKTINNSAQYLSKTIDDFRNFFSPNKIKDTFSLKESITTTLELVTAQYRSKNIDIITNIEDIELNTHKNELIQALINILNNARDELLKKPKEEKRYIFINTYEKNNKAVIEVLDNAGGIPTHVLDRLYEPYFTTKHQSQGTGIGLYMTEEIITKHLKGKIEASNKVFNYDGVKNRGALFKIILTIKNERTNS